MSLVTRSLFIFLMLIPVPSWAQNIIQSFPSTTTNATNMVSPGDLNGDGIADLALVSPSQGTVAIRSGSDGSLMFSFATGSTASAAEFVVVGDVDGDGLDDLALGLGTAALNSPVSEVRVFSSATGSSLLTIPSFQFACGHGYSIDRLSDLDGDAVDEIAIAAPFASTGGKTFNGSLRIHSGATGVLLMSMDGLASQDCFAIDTVQVGDEDADGVIDFAVASLRYGGKVQLFSAATLAEISSFTLGANSLSAISLLQRPLRLAGSCDVNGDGSHDYVVAKPSHDLSLSGNGNGAVFVVTASTASQVYRFDGSLGENLGADLSLGDFNGDGADDLAVLRAASNVVVYSGLTGNAIWQTSVGSTTRDLARVDSLDSDGIPDLAVLKQLSSNSGQLEIFAGGPWLGEHGSSHVGLSSVTEDILSLSGSTGSEARRVGFAVAQPFTIELAQPLVSILPADYALFRRLDCGLETEFFDLGSMGTMSFVPAPAATWAIPYLFTLAASVPQPGGELFSTPATPVSLGVPFGLPQPMTFTLQAVVLQGENTLRVTNGVIVSIK